MNDRHKTGERLTGHDPCPMCGGHEFIVQFTYETLMPLEVAFEFARSESYWREIHRCTSCGHFVESLDLDQTSLYGEDYVSSTYSDTGGLKRTFEKILALPAAQSDNAGRVARVLEFASRYLADRDPGLQRTLLDVGSGLCVFAARMREAGWDCTAIDLDQRLVEHAKNVAKVSAHLGSIETVHGIGPFDAISFNKVLEHVTDPVAMLASARKLLKAGGFVYVEVPDGEAAVVEGREREEFLLGHRHVFSKQSLELLIDRAGYSGAEVERLREPSGKFTLRAFLC